MINHFSLMTKVKDNFPIVYAGFRQYVPCLPHEGNVERVNSAAKCASDPNMDAEKLSRRIYIQQNIKTYPVCLEKVKAKYIEKFGSRLFVSWPASLKDPFK